MDGYDVEFWTLHLLTPYPHFLSAFLVLFAFSCGMNQLLWYYAELGTVCCHILIITTQRVVRIL